MELYATELYPRASSMVLRPVHTREWGNAFRNHASACAALIPASAGNTPHQAHRSRSFSVHPRGRGEHTVVELVNCSTHGSSPRARGTLNGVADPRVELRFIPAGAGNTGLPEAGEHLWPVHPRGRGEHDPLPLQLVASLGSSPRARGTLMPEYNEGDHLRFIPAGAGNTQAALASLSI